MESLVNGRYTERATKVIEVALREALSLGQNYVGTEHILLAILRDPDSLACEAIEGLVGQDRMRNEVIRLLQGHPEGEPKLEPPPKPDELEVDENHATLKAGSIELSVIVGRWQEGKKHVYPGGAEIQVDAEDCSPEEVRTLVRTIFDELNLFEFRRDQRKGEGEA